MARVLLVTNARPGSKMAGRDGFVLVGSSTRIVQAADEATWAALTSVERERAQALRRKDDRRDFFAAHLLVRRAAAMLTGASAAAFVVVQRCSECGGAHGRPNLAGHPELHVSISHTNGVAAAACSRHPIGVDIEHWNNAPEHHDDFAHVLSESERTTLDTCEMVACLAGPSPAQLAFLRLWTRKESLIKLGALTLDTLSTVDIHCASHPENAVHRWHRRTATGHWRFLDWSDPDTRIAGCAAGDGELELVSIGG